MKRVTRGKKFVYLSLTIIVILGIIVGYYISSNSTPIQINVIGTGAYGTVELEGTLFKETPVGVPGTYLLVNSAGNIAELEINSNIDNLIGAPVIVVGELIPPREPGGKQVIIVSSIQVKP